MSNAHKHQIVNTLFSPLSKPSISEDEIAAVADVLRSGWITTGAKNVELEQLVCDITGASYAFTECVVSIGIIYVEITFYTATDDRVNAAMIYLSMLGVFLIGSKNIQIRMLPIRMLPMRKETLYDNN